MRLAGRYEVVVIANKYFVRLIASIEPTLLECI